MHHSSCLPDIQNSFLLEVLHGINPPFLRPIHLVTTCTLPYIDHFSNPVILYSLHMAELSENNFINSFVHPLHPLHNSLIREFRTLFILLIPNKPLKLYIYTVLILVLSFSFHIIVSRAMSDVRP